MDATELMPTPRNVLRTMRWSFDMLVWSQQVTRQLICGLVSPLLPASLRRDGRGGAEATGATTAAQPVGAEPTTPELSEPSAAVAELPAPEDNGDLLPAVRPSFGVEELVAEAGIAPPEPAADDDLTRINGIGPRMAERLAHLGVTSLGQLAAWTPQDIAQFEEHLPAMQRGKVEREGWVEQARALLAG